MMHTIDWFEIPTTNLDRAAKFYETVLGVRLKHETAGRVPEALIVSEKGAVGALIQDPRRKPNPDGTLVYLNAGKDLDACLERVTRAGGRIVLPRTDIGDPGSIAIFADPEGNTVGLHVEK